MNNKAYGKVEVGEASVRGGNPFFATLASSLKDGHAVNDNGNAFQSLTHAINDANTWVVAGPGTFDETVTITGDEFSLYGVGDGTLVDGGSIGDAITVSSTDVTVSNIRATSSSGHAFYTVDNGQRVMFDNVTASAPSGNGVYINTPRGIVMDCELNNSGGQNFRAAQSGGSDSFETIIANTFSSDSGQEGILLSRTDQIAANCAVLNPASDGIRTTGSRSIVIGNRVNSAGDNGLDSGFGSNNILANNRVSNSTNADINDSATSTTLDANLTGANN